MSVFAPMIFFNVRRFEQQKAHLSVGFLHLYKQVN